MKFHQIIYHAGSESLCPDHKFYGIARHQTKEDEIDYDDEKKGKERVYYTANDIFTHFVSGLLYWLTFSA